MEYAQKGLCKQSEIALHTHDSISYKRCRRKWMFSSPFRRHLQPKASIVGANQHLWFGSGFHFSLEDYHGLKRFTNAVEAFEAYVDAFAPEELPNNVDELVPMGVDMLAYYEEWERDHCKWKTVVIDGVPQVEVKFSLVLAPLCHYIHQGYKYFNVGDGRWFCETIHDFMDEATLIAFEAEYVEIVFHGTIDRLVEDANGNWWVLDYKTAKTVDTGKLSLDPQISKYCWAAEQWFQHEIEGMVYVQCSKSPPHPPKTTSKGISTDKRQRTTHGLYREALIAYYGEIQKAPKDCITYLNDLADVETENGNAFIRYDWVPRNEASKINTYAHIISEGREILREDLPLYPNPTKDCSWDCPFRDMCLAMEEGADWEYYLDEFEKRPETMDNQVPRWQLRLYAKHPDKYPEEFEKYCKIASVDNADDFLAKLAQEELEIDLIFDRNYQVREEE